jgi:hypothetical protein
MSGSFSRLRESQEQGQPLSADEKVAVGSDPVARHASVLAVYHSTYTARPAVNGRVILARLLVNVVRAFVLGRTLLSFLRDLAD